MAAWHRTLPRHLPANVLRLHPAPVPIIANERPGIGRLRSLRETSPDPVRHPPSPPAGRLRIAPVRLLLQQRRKLLRPAQQPSVAGGQVVVKGRLVSPVRDLIGVVLHRAPEVHDVPAGIGDDLPLVRFGRQQHRERAGKRFDVDRGGVLAGAEAGPDDLGPASLASVVREWGFEAGTRLRILSEPEAQGVIEGHCLAGGEI